MAVARIKPDFVERLPGPAAPPGPLRWSASMIDRIPMPIGRRCIAAEQDLIIRADGHSLRAGADGDAEPGSLHDRLGLRD